MHQLLKWKNVCGSLRKSVGCIRVAVIFVAGKIKGRLPITLPLIFALLSPSILYAQDNISTKKIYFDIPRQSAELSLIGFAEQAGLTLILPFKIVQGITTNRLQGKYLIEPAVKQLLNNTGLAAEVEADGQIRIFVDPDGLGASTTKMNGFRSVLGSIFSSIFGASDDAGDTTTDNGLMLEEVIVTARRKAENIQAVPDTIVAMSSHYVQESNINSAQDVSMRIPNVSIVESLSPTSTYIIVRGIASVRNSEPAVAVIIDGVQVGSATEVSQSFYDVERIELLKGPQGALYGRNAVGGALIITSKEPTDDFSANLTGGTGSSGLSEISGSVSGPLAENFHFRIAANSKSFDGNIKNEFLNNTIVRGNAQSALATSNQSNHSRYMDFQDNEDLRIRLIWEPTDKTLFDYRYSENNLETGAMWYRNIYRLESDPGKTYELPINAYGNPIAIRSINTHTLKFDHYFEIGSLTSITNHSDSSERYGVAGETRGHDRTGNVLFTTDVFVNNFIEDLSDPIDQNFFANELSELAAGNFVGSDQYYDIETFSQELRFSGDIGDKVSYITGAYLLLTERNDTIRATWETPAGSSFDCPPLYAGGPAVTDYSCNGLIFSTENEQDNTAWAVFFSADFQLAENLVLTTAARYDEDQREVTRIDGPTVDTFNLGVGRCDSLGDPENCVVSGSKISKTFTAFQPKISLAYMPNKKFTLYGTYAKGFRSGGFNASGALLTDTYKDETLHSFELGFKSPLLKGRLRSNFSAFFQRYQNAQQFEFDGNIYVQSLYNIPESEIRGLEASFDFIATQSLTLTASFGVMDSKILEFDRLIRDRMLSELNNRITNSISLPAKTLAAFERNFHGAHLPSFAHKTANFELVHEWPIFSNGMIISRIEYSYADKLYWWMDEQDVQESLILADASVALAIDENLKFQFWCKNCTDQIYDSEYSPNERELFGGAAKDVAYRARGRTYGVKLNYAF